MVDDLSPELLESLLAVLDQEPGSVEELVIQRTLRPALAYLHLDSGARAERAPPSATRPAAADLAAIDEQELVELAIHTARRLTRQLLQTVPKIQAKVADLLLLPPTDRHDRAVADASLWHPAAVREILEQEAGMLESPLDERESILLLATELAERMAYGDFPRGLAADARASAWSRLSELLLVRRESRQAEFALTAAQIHLAQGTGDPEVAYDVTLRWAFFLWLQGRTSDTGFVLQAVIMLATAMHDVQRLAYADLWLHTFYLQSGARDRAQQTYQRAAGRVGPSILSLLAERQSRVFEQLGLAAASLPVPESTDTVP